jgi:hypothetical protein
MTSFRDTTVVVLETSRDTISAGYGLHELLQRPAVVRLTLLLSMIYHLM